jgi:hypothetical protein
MRLEWSSDKRVGSHAVAVRVRHQLLHHLPHLENAIIHVDPVHASGEEHHRIIYHAHDVLPPVHFACVSSACRWSKGGLQLRGVPEGARIYGRDSLASHVAENAEASGTVARLADPGSTPCAVPSKVRATVHLVSPK